MKPQDHRISIDEAKAMIERRAQRMDLAIEAAQTRERDAHARGTYKGGAFDAAQVRALLAQDGVAELRIYRGDHPDGRPAHILVAVDQSGEDMTDLILEIERPCPPACSPSGVLGSGTD